MGWSGSSGKPDAGCLDDSSDLRRCMFQVIVHDHVVEPAALADLPVGGREPFGDPLASVRSRGRGDDAPAPPSTEARGRSRRRRGPASGPARRPRRRSPGGRRCPRVAAARPSASACRTDAAERPRPTRGARRRRSSDRTRRRPRRSSRHPRPPMARGCAGGGADGQAPAARRCATDTSRTTVPLPTPEGPATTKSVPARSATSRTSRSAARAAWPPDLARDGSR